MSVFQKRKQGVKLGLGVVRHCDKMTNREVSVYPHSSSNLRKWQRAGGLVACSFHFIHKDAESIGQVAGDGVQG